MNRYNGWGYRAEDNTVSPVSATLAKAYASQLPSPVSPVAQMPLSSIPAPHALAGHLYPRPIRENNSPPSHIPPAANFKAPQPRLNQVADGYNPYYYPSLQGQPQPHLPLRKTSAQRLRLNVAAPQHPSQMTPSPYNPESSFPPYRHPQPPPRQYADLPSNPYQQMRPDHYNPSSSYRFPPQPPSGMSRHDPYAKPWSVEGSARYNLFDNALGLRPGTSPVSSNERRANNPVDPYGAPPTYNNNYYSDPRAVQPQQIRKMPSASDKMVSIPNPHRRDNNYHTYPSDRGPTHASYLNLVQPEQYLFPDESSGESGSRSPSNFDNSGTERSSVVTKASSFSDHNYTPPPGGKLLGHQKSISVEEYISMYEDGFDDFHEPDLVPEPLSPSQAPPSTLSSPRSWDKSPIQHFAKPKADLDRSLPPTPPTKFPVVAPRLEKTLNNLEAKDKPMMQNPPKNRGSTDSKSRQQAILSKELPKTPTVKLHKPVSRDRYGFKKRSQNVSEADYNTWNSTYTGYLERRRKKWDALMKSHDLSTINSYSFPPRCEKVKRYIRKGIPPNWRGAAWFWYAGGPESLAKNPNLYASLLRKVQAGALSELDREHIERDLNRTFPDNKRFKPDPSINDLRASAGTGYGYGSGQETSILKALRRVLQGFAVHNPDIGYCQSLNFIAGLLLLFLNEDEQKVFTMLDIITKNYLPGTHGVVLANADVAVLMTLIRESMPAVWSKINDLPPNTDLATSTRLPTVSLASTSWFMSCFIGTLPIESVLRVWDVLFYEGSKTLFRVGLALFKSGEQSIKAVTDPLEVFQVVQSLPRGLIDANELMGLCYGKKKKKRKGGIGNGQVSQEVIDRRRVERRKMHAEERARAGK